MSKETSEQTLYWIARIMIIFITTAFLIVMIGKISTGEANPHETKNYVTNNKIILDCLRYESRFGVIDNSKFNQIEDCINTNSELIINLTYNGINQEKRVNPNLIEESFCFDEETFYCNKEEFYVIVVDSYKEYKGKLTITELKLKSMSEVPFEFSGGGFSGGGAGGNVE